MLPRYDNTPFVRILQHSYFGVVDIIAACFEIEMASNELASNKDKNLKLNGQGTSYFDVDESGQDSQEEDAFFEDL